MNILLASSEVAPFAQTGGLGDVCGALPGELTRLGHQVTVVAPAYRQVKQTAAFKPTNLTFDVPIGAKIVRGRLLEGQLPNTATPIYFVEQDGYYDRAELYREQGVDYADNCERFVFFARAVIEAIRLLRLPVEVVHCNDWQTGLIPAYLKIENQHTPGYEHIGSLLTIHNMAYQGVFWHWDMLLTGLDWKYFNWRQMEFHGKLNMLKTGLTFADSINTVSPRYAQEIQQPPWGAGLEGVLRQRQDVLSGILNGIDTREWNPAGDSHLPARYDANTWKAGKASCKQYLQQEMQLPVEPRRPLLGLIGRLAEQKGWDLVLEVMRRWLRHREVQWVVLGRGEQKYQDQLAQLASEYPYRLAARLTFSPALAHRIEAGADMFVMPSEFEPCGLNQQYSLRYGAVPVVRQVGGLYDTVRDANGHNLGNGSANGFVFDAFSPDALEQALDRACATLGQRPAEWERLVATGMNGDYSWTKSAQEYVQLYQLTARRRRAWQGPA